MKEQDHSWQDKARCREIGLELFINDLEFSVRLLDEQAKAVCHRCIVERECLDYALSFDSKGIWGGTSERQRKDLRRNLGIVLQPSQ